jgi:hypothetical protein
MKPVCDWRREEAHRVFSRLLVKNYLEEFSAIAFLLSVHEMLYPGLYQSLGIIVVIITVVSVARVKAFVAGSPRMPFPDRASFRPAHIPVLLGILGGPLLQSLRQYQIQARVVHISARFTSWSIGCGAGCLYC